MSNLTLKLSFLGQKQKHRNIAVRSKERRDSNPGWQSEKSGLCCTSNNLLIQTLVDLQENRQCIKVKNDKFKNNCIYFIFKV